jgi:LysM repeat protein
MAKKTPKKFRQARAAAKADAKKVFSGKKQAVRRDPSLKYSADDVKALREVSQEARAGIITDDRGNRINVKPTETARERIARENAEAMRKFREQAEMEDGPKKTEPAKKVEASKKFTKKAAKKAPVKKAAAAKPATKPAATAPAAAKKPTRAEKSAANKARWAKMTPAERKNWSATKGTEAKPAIKKAAAAPKAAPVAKEPVAKRPTLASLKKNEAKALAEAKKRVEAKKAAAKPVERKKITVDKKTSTVNKPTAGAQALEKMQAKAKAKAAAPKKFGKIKATAKGGAALALAGEVVSLAKGSTAKDAAEINRLRNKLADLEGKKRPGALSRFKEGAASEAAQLASLATMGIVGKTRRQRMDELNKKIKKTAGKKPELRYGKDGSSLVPGTAAYKAGSKTRPTNPVVNKPTTGGGGTTTNVYTVKKGDTLSGIAKANQTTLAAIREANPTLMNKKKYKQGNMIWSGTKVRIPKK